MWKGCEWPFKGIIVDIKFIVDGVTWCTSVKRTWHVQLSQLEGEVAHELYNG